MNANSFQSYSKKTTQPNLLKQLFTARTLTVAAVVLTLPFLVLSLMPNPALRRYDNASANTAGLAVEPESMTVSGDVTISSDGSASNGQYITFATPSAAVIPTDTPAPTLEATLPPVSSSTPEASGSGQ
jgi:hypothetical protein